MSSCDLVLVDGMALAYRGHFALIKNPRMTSSGLNTSSVFVFANVLLNLLETCSPSHIAVAFDGPEKTQRHELFPAYKATRDAMPEDLAAALPYLDRLCAALNIPVIRDDGWEADDIIGTLARHADERGMSCLMVTPDKDFAQLVSERVKIYKPGRRGDEAEILGPAEIKQSWGIERIDQVVDILGLMGDASDNIPGVPGIGAKTAQKLVAEFGSMEGVYQHLDEITGKRRENLETHREQAFLSKRLVTIERGIELASGIDDLVRRELDQLATRELFTELEFNTLGQRLLGEDFAAAGAVEAGAGSIETVFHDYRIAASEDEQRALASELAAASAVALDTETTGTDHHCCDLVGMSFCCREHEAWYVPVPEDPQEARAVVARFALLWEAEGVELIGHNLHFDLAVLRRCGGVEPKGPLFDTMLAAFLVMPDARRSMDALAEDLLGYRPIPIGSLIGDKKSEQIALREVPLERLAEYAAEDADVTFQLAEVFRALVEEGGAQRVFHEVECPLVPVLVRMEAEGITVDAAGLEQLSVRLGAGIDELALRIRELAGEDFNLNSPKQLGTILFDVLQLDPRAKKTKTGQYKTDEAVLQRLALRHELPQAVLDYRALNKLKGTYVDALPGYIEADGRIRTHYHQAAAATGRLASNDPNLQNIPVRSDRGREIREAFVPRAPGWRLLSADYSQVELRIAAHLSDDANMRAAFAAGTDFHSATAELLAGGGEVDAELRRRAKTVNFGILYGVSAFGLAERLGIPRGEAKDLIDAYYASYPKLREWMDATLEFARSHGYVETMTGRRRYLRDIDSRNGAQRAGAERVAINAPIQGTAADLIKLAMVRIDRELGARSLESRMLLQVHDELVFDLHPDEGDVVPELVETAMREALPMTVPLAVEVGVGSNWLEAH